MADVPGGKPKILIVEDDEAIADGLALNLKLEGFDPVTVHDGEAAIEKVEDLEPRLILLDISLPMKSGLDVLSELRQGGNRTAIIVLSARQNETDKVAALRLGADDYVTKPFGVAELLARIDAVLRRSSAISESTESRRLTFAGLSVDLDTREVRRGDESVVLTHLEFELLSFFARNPAKVFPRKELLRKVWGLDHSGSPRTVDNFVAQLRSKLEEDPNEPRHFVTVRGSGYRFDP